MNMLTRSLTLMAFFVALLGVGLAHQQPNPADKDKAKAPAFPDGDIDAIGKEAAALEAQLAKTSSASKDGAEIQLKLIDLYHANGRPFGLVRSAQTFVSQ